ncbi:MAG: DUF4350 domain-containing protein [Candidatus Eremiobacteraeota bacterium]|nr:DUF4350 domain-containing protein [Candidatus Eremiobacteraeota bacterium]
MKRSRVEFAIVVVGALVLALLVIERDAATRSLPPSVLSTYDTGPNGYRATYEVLRQAGVPVRRFESVLGLLDSDIRTLVISGYEDDPNAKPLDEKDAAALKRFVTGGGRLVVLDSAFAGSKDVTPGVGVTHAAASSGAVALASNRFTAGVARVAGPVEDAFGFSERQGVPLLANDKGVVAIAYAYGKGEVVAISAPALFSNAQAASPDNVRFAYDVVAGHGPAAFDEYVHGYDSSLSLWAALPQPVRVALWIVAAIVLLGLIGANVPFAPPIPAEGPDERDSSAYIDAVAALMQRARLPLRKDVYGR